MYQLVWQWLLKVKVFWFLYVKTTKESRILHVIPQNVTIAFCMKKNNSSDASVMIQEAQKRPFSALLLVSCLMPGMFLFFKKMNTESA